MNLKVGEKITIVDYGATILTEVVDVQKSSATVAYRSSHGLKNNDEGVYWLRGHHLPDSPEVRGAVTAKALSVPEEKSAAGPSPLTGGFQAIAHAFGSSSVLQGALIGALAGVAHELGKKKASSK